MRSQAKLLPALVFAAVLMANGLAHTASANEAARPSSQENLFKLGVALLQYSDDYEGKLPLMQDAAVVKKALDGFVKDDALIQPETKLPYAPNPVLSEQKHVSFNDQKVIAFYEVQPDKDRKRWVLFLPPFDPKVIHFETNSGFVKNYIKQLSEDEWLEVKPPGKDP